MRGEPLIIGGGPAGTAAAITLARAGHRPILLERSSGPSDKVCGDFMSHDTIQRARSLGVDPLGLGAAAIRLVRVIHGERVAEAALPFPAVGLSRRVLDAALLQQAEAAGAVVQTGRTVRRLTRDGAGWRVDTGDQAGLTAETVFLATGKHDLRDAPRAHTKRDAVGMKMYMALRPAAAAMLEGATELTLFPGGYAGMQFVEDGRVVLCIAVQRGHFRAYGGGWTALIDAIRQRSRQFAALLNGARDLLARPLAVGAIPYGYQAPPSGVFRLGDQAAVIPSLTGDGMAIALHSGQLAAEAWLRGVDAGSFQSGLKRTLTPQMRLALMLHRAGLSGPGQMLALPILRQFPGLLQQAALWTRLPRSCEPGSRVQPEDAV